MAGIVYPVFGKYELAVEEARKTVILDPDFSFGYNVLAVNYLALNRLNEAEAALDRAAERKLAIPDYLVDRYNLAFLAGSRAGMEEQVLLSRGKPEVEDSLSNLDGFVSANVGRLQTARERSRQAADLAQRAGHRERAALYEAGAAVREALFGNSHAATERAGAALKLSTNREVEYGLAFALALVCDSGRSPALANELGTRFQADTAVIWPRTGALKPPRNSRKSSTIAELCSAIPSAPWRVFNLAERSPHRERSRRPHWRTRTS